MTIWWNCIDLFVLKDKNYTVKQLFKQYDRTICATGLFSAELLPDVTEDRNEIMLFEKQMVSIWGLRGYRKCAEQFIFGRFFVTFLPVQKSK